MVRLYEAGVFVSRILSHPPAKGCKSDTDLGADDLQALAEAFKALVEKHLGKPFPNDPLAQMWGGIAAVFKSWNDKKAVSYRRIEGIPDDWSTAVNVQAMVFGNMDDSSVTGVAFTRDPASVDFCYKTGLTYVSCSPFRVPIARLAAAQAAIKAGMKK